MKKIFAKDDLKKIKDKVTQAERLTDAEIVPFITQASSGYVWVYFVGGALGWAVSSIIISALSFNSPWAFSLPEYLMFQSFCIAAGVGLSFTHFFKKILIRKSHARREVEKLAFATFMRLGVHRTQNRCGVLLFISLLEKKIFLIADEGIYHKMPAAFWQSQVDNLSKGIREGQEIETLGNIIEGLGRKLAEYFPHTDTHQNQLPDDMKTE